jgi:hypothetical protein
VELGVRGQTLPRQETVKQFGKRFVLGVLLAAIVDECQYNEVAVAGRRQHPIVRRVRSSQSSRVSLSLSLSLSLSSLH